MPCLASTASLPELFDIRHGIIVCAVHICPLKNQSVPGTLRGNTSSPLHIEALDIWCEISHRIRRATGPFMASADSVQVYSIHQTEALLCSIHHHIQYQKLSTDAKPFPAARAFITSGQVRIQFIDRLTTVTGKQRKSNQLCRPDVREQAACMRQTMDNDVP